MIRFFLHFLREKEKTRVFSKDSQAKARRESFQEKGQIGAKVFKAAKKKLQNGKKNCLKKHFLGQNFEFEGCETQPNRHPAEFMSNVSLFRNE
jgi:hypothetical protein